MTLTVACSTEKCENFDIPIDVEVALPYVVVCGPCGTQLAEDETVLPVEPASAADELTDEVN